MPELVVFDMDGVICEHFNFWLELHKVWGTLEEGKELTKKYLKTDYCKLVQEVIGRLWADKPAQPYYSLVKSVKYVVGAKDAVSKIKLSGCRTAIITSGPYDLALRVQQELGVDFIYANKLLIENDRIVGTNDMSLWTVQNDEKVVPFQELCKQLNITPEKTVAVIHDENDIKLAKYVRQHNGRVIGFMYESHAEVEKNCDVVVRERDLRAILPHISLT